MEKMKRVYAKEDIAITETNFIHVKGIGRVGLWWRYYDHQVNIDYSIGNSFIAHTEDAVILGVLNILNEK